MFIVIETVYFSIKQRSSNKNKLISTKSHELRSLSGISLKITLNVCFSRRYCRNSILSIQLSRFFLRYKSGRRDFQLHTASSAFMSVVAWSKAIMTWVSFLKAEEKMTMEEGKQIPWVRHSKIRVVTSNTTGLQPVNQISSCAGIASFVAWALDWLVTPLRG